MKFSISEDAEIAEALEQSEVNCRQVLRRARQHVSSLSLVSNYRHENRTTRLTAFFRQQATHAESRQKNLLLIPFYFITLLSRSFRGKFVTEFRNAFL